MATPAPLMPKATAVWLLDNTALWFDQIAEFCKLHPLEVKPIADADAAMGIKPPDPILTGQLTREQITEAEANPGIHLTLTASKVATPQVERGGKKGPRYTPVSRRQDLSLIHISEPTRQAEISYAVFCLKKKKKHKINTTKKT